jgi:succinate dehydrogenase / fumarate reductase cytochrome b subunit
VNDKRPINLDLTSLKYPPMAIVSILHRISGLVLFLLMPVMLYLLSLSLHSTESFTHLQTLLLKPSYKFLLWVFSISLVYHLLAGIRHMIMDLGYGEELGAGRISATIIIIAAFILAIFLGIWLC